MVKKSDDSTQQLIASAEKLVKDGSTPKQDDPLSTNSLIAESEKLIQRKKQSPLPFVVVALAVAVAAVAGWFFLQ